MNAIEVQGLTKRFGDFVAVDHVSFEVPQGEVFGLLGPNGAGKTTLIRMITTLTPPSEGVARVAGHDVRKDPEGVRNSIGVIPQALTSDPELTAEENLKIHAKIYGVPAEERETLIRELLEAVDLAQFSKALVGTFSGGMRRRLEIARGLVHSPKILFLDEPTTGLDPVSRTNVWEMIEKLQTAVRPHDPAHHPLHGRSGQAVREDRHRRPRKTGGAGFAHAAEGQRSRQRGGRGRIYRSAARLARSLRRAPAGFERERARRRYAHHLQGWT